MVNAVFESGPPMMIWIHDSERVMHPPEEEAFLHARNPHAARFIDAPPSKRKKIVPPAMRPDSAWCTGCRDWHSVDCFHKDSTRPSGLQSYCRDYRAAYRKAAPAKTQVSWHWHRGR